MQFLIRETNSSTHPCIATGVPNQSSATQTASGQQFTHWREAGDSGAATNPNWKPIVSTAILSAHSLAACGLTARNILAISSTLPLGLGKCGSVCRNFVFLYRSQKETRFASNAIESQARNQSQLS